jgi:cation transport protein ChaC
MSKVDRAVLERDGVRNAMREAGYGHLLLSDEQLAHSLASVLGARTPGKPMWVFGYGSLIWSPTFHFVERRVARARGYHRGFYLWSKVNRGTPERPGLVLGLDRGGSCGGVAFRVEESVVEQELSLLWRREMVLGTYVPRWVSVEMEQQPARAIAFVVNRATPNYAGRLTDERIVSVALQAHGHYGACADYLLRTAESLEQHGIPDRRLDRLARLLRARQDAPASARARA